MCWPVAWWLWGAVRLPDDAALMWVNQAIHYPGHFSSNPVEILFLLSHLLAFNAEWSQLPIGFTILGTLLGWIWAWGCINLPLPLRLRLLIVSTGWIYLIWDFSLTAAAGLVCFVGLWQLLHARKNIGILFALLLFTIGVLIRDKSAVIPLTMLGISFYLFKMIDSKIFIYRFSISVSILVVINFARVVSFPAEHLELNDAFTRVLDLAECGSLASQAVENNMILLALHNWFLGDPVVHTSTEVTQLLDETCKPAPGQFIRNILNAPFQNPVDLFSLVGSLCVFALLIHLNWSKMMSDFRWLFALILILILLSGFKFVARVWVPLVLIWAILAMIYQGSTYRLSGFKLFLSSLILVTLLFRGVFAVQESGVQKYGKVQARTGSNTVLLTGPGATLLTPLNIRDEAATVRFFEGQPIEIFGGWPNLTSEFRNRVIAIGGMVPYLYLLEKRNGNLYLVGHQRFIDYFSKHMNHYYKIQISADPVDTINGLYGSVQLFRLKLDSTQM
jgi:hypothetical protein